MNQDWPGMLDDYGVQFLILDRRADRDLLEFFRMQPRWGVDFEDEEAVIFTRLPGALQSKRALDLHIPAIRDKRIVSGVEHE